MSINNFIKKLFEMPPPLIQKGDLFNIPKNPFPFVQVETDTIKHAGTVSKKWILSAILEGHDVYRVQILKSVKELKEGDRIVNLVDYSHILIGERKDHPVYDDVKKNLKDWCKIIKL